MLYLTTRDKYDAYTAYRTLHGDTAPNGGLYIPFRMPKVSMDEIKDKSFCACVADTLNLFFATHLTGKEIEFSIGRYPLRIRCVKQKILIAETWRNLDGSYGKMERRLAAKVCGCSTNEVKIPSWLAIAIRIAVLFGIFSELLRENMITTEDCVDISVPSGNFRLPMAVWYGREMGLPIGNIVCACDQNSCVWDLLHLGEMRPAGDDPSVTELERLICANLGTDEAVRYKSVLEKGGVYTLQPDRTEMLGRSMFSASVSPERMYSMISNVYRTNSSILEPAAAISYGGLMDYRARAGENRAALLLSDENPAEHAQLICDAMNISEESLNDLLRKA